MVLRPQESSRPKLEVECGGIFGLIPVKRFWRNLRREAFCGLPKLSVTSNPGLFIESSQGNGKTDTSHGLRVVPQKHELSATSMSDSHRGASDLPEGSPANGQFISIPESSSPAFSPSSLNPAEQVFSSSSGWKERYSSMSAPERKQARAEMLAGESPSDGSRPAMRVGIDYMMNVFSREDTSFSKPIGTCKACEMRKSICEVCALHARVDHLENGEIPAPKRFESLPFFQSALRERKPHAPSIKQQFAVPAKYGKLYGESSLSNPPPFFLASRRLYRSELRLEAAAKLSREKPRDPELRERALLALADRDRLNHAAFRCFAEGLGCQVSPSAFFDKKAMNLALEQLLGSCNSEATGEFSYPGIKVPKDHLYVLRCFSLYMGKKVFAPGNPLSPPTLSPYYDMMTTPPKYPLPRLAMIFFRRLARVLCRRPKNFDWATQNIGASKKSCLERTQLEGGKRAAIWQVQDTPFDCAMAVIACIIYTGGKFRDVTIAGMLTHKFTVFNQLLGSKLKQCKSSVFGRDVEAWVVDVIENILRQRGKFADFVFCSGDLKSATNLLHRMIAVIFCDELVDQFELTPSDEELLRGYTYDAVYHERHNRDVHPVRACGCLHFPACGHRLKQKGGWNMGSDISFPILCAASLYSLVKAQGQLEYACSIVDPRKFWEFLRDFDGGGFNGDDQICWGPRSVVDRWLEAVESINGVPEPSKSPVNSEYFTINSRLFKLSGEEVKAVQTVHPGKLYSVLRGSVAAPDRHWLDLINCPKPWRKELGVDMALRPQIPVQMGGSGLKRQLAPSDKLFEMLRWCELSKPQLESEKFEVFIGKKKELADVERHEGLFTVSRDHWKTYCTERFGSPKGLYWTSQSSLQMSDVELVDRSITDSRDEITRHRLWKLYNVYWDAAEKGEVVLRNPSVPWTVPLKRIENVDPGMKDEAYLAKPSTSSVIESEQLDDFAISLLCKEREVKGVTNPISGPRPKKNFFTIRSANCPNPRVVDWSNARLSSSTLGNRMVDG